MFGASGARTWGGVGTCGLGVWIALVLGIGACASEESAEGEGGTDTGGTVVPDVLGPPGGGVPTFDGFVSDTSVDVDAESPPIDAPGVEDAPDVQEVAEPPKGCTPVGGACNDGDVCTFNDTCLPNGECKGTPLDCDDGAPCTIDKCVGGTCTSGVQDGFCFIDGVCWSANQPNPTSPLCERCTPQNSVATWTISLNQPCSDGDACTQNDFCTSQGCKGTPVQCSGGGLCVSVSCDTALGCVYTDLVGPCALPSDGPCKAGQCQQGQCVSVAKADGADCEDGNSCTVGDICFQGSCISGAALDADGDGYTAASCGGADCNDNNFNVNPGAAEICDDGIDNDCDGATDGEDDDCCGGAACTFHLDCGPAQVCADWPPSCGPRCSVPCAGPQQCPLGQICVHMPGSAGYGYCRPSKNPAGKASGAVCGSAKECKSEICVGLCADYCGRQGACAGGTCSPAGNLQGEFFGICAPGIGIGTLPLGAQCSNSNTCVSGHCDLLAPTFKSCSPLCKSDSDCLLSQECNIAMPAGGAAPGTVGGKTPANSMPFASFYQNKTFDMGLACYQRQYASATAGTGAACTHPNQCRSNKCFALDASKPNQQWCTTFCATDADCPTTMRCSLEIVTLVSYWLVNYGGANQNVGTFVRMCTWK